MTQVLPKKPVFSPRHQWRSALCTATHFARLRGQRAAPPPRSPAHLRAVPGGGGPSGRSGAAALGSSLPTVVQPLCAGHLPLQE